MGPASMPIPPELLWAIPEGARNLGLPGRDRSVEEPKIDQLAPLPLNILSLREAGQRLPILPSQPALRPRVPGCGASRIHPRARACVHRLRQDHLLPRGRTAGMLSPLVLSHAKMQLF